jgi:GMP synthase (glutamine-hydrolyzing)
MGGGPANFAYRPEEKSAEQRQFEAVIMPLLREIIARDIPFLGACLGVGALVSALGGTPSFAYGEAIGAVPITLTPAARDDPLLADLPTTFDGFVGHKEGVLEPPAACTVLARSRRCVQMLRVGRNVYATQFHPELDPESLALRIDIYRHAGYCAPDEADTLIANARQQTVTEPIKILRQFVQRYRQ